MDSGSIVGDVVAVVVGDDGDGALRMTFGHNSVHQHRIHAQYMRNIKNSDRQGQGWRVQVHSNDST